MQHERTGPILQAIEVSFAPQIFTRKPISSSIAAYEILQRLSFTVDRGDLVALVGASGAGKTSLLRLLNRLSEPTQGTLYFEQQPFANIPVPQLRRQIVGVLQESKLLGMTVQQALEYPLQLRRVPSQTMQHTIAEWTQRLHIPTDWLARTEQQLSVGQRQWVAIARALITQPKILLLDEPTASLDVGRAHLFLTLLKDLSQTEGLTVLMANHQLELAAEFCDRILHLDHGQLLQDIPAAKIDWTALTAQLRLTETEQAAEWE